MAKHHKKHPDNDDYQNVILDALFALGKNEDNFNWIENPVVLRMSKETPNRIGILPKSG